MGGRLSREIDRTGRWRQECSALEDRLGYTAGVIYEDWRVTADLRQHRSVAVMAREVHEEMAFLNVLELFDKCGATMDVAN
jgi:hypothetical protein